MAGGVGAASIRAGMSSERWWRGAVVYQIYPRSFFDTNADGIGDLRGIAHKLDYVQSLGVDAIWVSPFFKSPMKDFGYDVSDYRDVDPMFGSLADFDHLLDAAHRRGLKVLIDLVLSHTSDQHPWFLESKQSRENAKADWYVWSDPKPDGSPPNNWLSVFGGVAWEWEPRRRQYYLHNFLASQPDLNFHCEAVVEAVLDVARFWLDRGVDGFRLDTANFYTHDQELRDNPPAGSRVKTDGTFTDNPYAYQLHLYDKSRPENFRFLRRLRKLMDRYPGRFTIGEVASDDSLVVAASYVRGDQHLHTAYTFDLLTPTFSARHIRAVLERMEELIEDGWPCWSFGNHDVARVATRWGHAHDSSRFARVLVALLGSLRGTVCLYQGDELGLSEADVPYERLQDPYGIAFWPEHKGRDGCRTPMPWRADEAGAGFSVMDPWLPVSNDHARLAVDRQERESDSTLHAVRRFLAFRRDLPPLVAGTLRFLGDPEEESLLLFERSLGGRTLLCAFNLGEETRRVTAPPKVSAIHGLPGTEGRLEGDTLVLPGLAWFFGEVG